jgi:hypothetical protein
MVLYDNSFEPKLDIDALQKKPEKKADQPNEDQDETNDNLKASVSIDCNDLTMFQTVEKYLMELVQAQMWEET